MKLILINDTKISKDKLYKNGPVIVRDKVIYVPIENKKPFDLGVLYFKELGRKVVKWLKEKEVKQVTINFDNLNNTIISKNYITSFLVGLNIGKMSAKDFNFSSNVSIINDITSKQPLIKYKPGKDVKTFNKLLYKAQDITTALLFLIKTVNTPHNLLPLENIKDKIQDLFKGVENVNIWEIDDEYLKRHNYNLIRAVCRASKNKPYLLRLNYTPKKSKNPIHIVLVGKGIHFDSGGINLKPYDSMVTMKYDKAGALTVISVLYLAAKLKLNIKLDVVVGFAENMIDHDSYKPGDVLKAKNGKTIEVIHTDAEGRLLLADCLQYVDDVIKDYEEVITVATLTGAARRALGEYTAAIHSTEYELSEPIIESGYQTGESLNYMYPHPKLKETLKSKIADIRNKATTDLAGSITAFWFLTNFIKDPNKLVHLDIAGPGWTEKGFGYVNYGATGFGVETLLGYLESLHYSSISDY